MAFENLTSRLQTIFSRLKRKGKLQEEDVHESMREVKLALLEADVNYKVVKKFISDVEAKAIGSEVFESLSPAQTVLRIVRDELIATMGGESVSLSLKPAGQVTTIMMVGLQGAGKTTTVVKLGGKFKSSGRRILLAAGDVYRPAAIKQLKINANSLGLDVYSEEDNPNPVEIVKNAYKKAVRENYSVLILDTAGRLHVDENMMEELKNIKENIPVDYTILTVDAMTGQDAVTSASSFAKSVGIDGLIMTKLDGDERGGAALSIQQVTGKPVYFVGTGEKLDELQQFYPDRMASRILGMGDVLSLIEKAEENLDHKKQEQALKNLRKSQFTYDDFLTQLEQMKKMGGLQSILSMLPGFNSLNVDSIDQGQFDKIEAVILSMTPEERANPRLMNPSRKRRISIGSGTDIAHVNRIVKQFDEMQKMMKQINGMRKHGNLNTLFGRNAFRGNGIFK